MIELAPDLMAALQSEADRQGELIHGLGKPQTSQAMILEDMAEAVVRKMREADANASAPTAI
jgi:hypothetical protein